MMVIGYLTINHHIKPLVFEFVCPIQSQFSWISITGPKDWSKILVDSGYDGIFQNCLDQSFGPMMEIHELKQLKQFKKDTIPNGTLSSRRVVPHPSSPTPICKNVTIRVENRPCELKLSEFRSVSVQITVQTN